MIAEEYERERNTFFGAWVCFFSPDEVEEPGIMPSFLRIKLTFKRRRSKNLNQLPILFMALS